MSLISQAVSQLINGVSQQAPSQRLPSQAEAQENAYSSPVDGLKKRPGTTHVARLEDAETAVAPHVHVIERDQNEQFVVLVEDGDLKVYDLKTGAPQTVNFPKGKDYLLNDTPRTGFRALTVEDYTFILNKTARPTIAPVPYFEDDQLSAAISFGSGQLQELAPLPIPPNRRIYVRISGPFTSGTYPNGVPISTMTWTSVPGSLVITSTVQQAIAAFFDYWTDPENSAGYYLELDENYDFEENLEVKLEAGIPVQDEEVADLWSGTPFAQLVFGAKEGKRLMGKWKGTSAADPNTAVDLNFRVVWGRELETDLEFDDPNMPNTAAELWADAGWPLNVGIPGFPRTQFAPIPQLGYLAASVNGKEFREFIEADIPADQYVDKFIAKFSLYWPDIEFTKSGHVMNVKAPAGVPLFVSCRAWNNDTGESLNVVNTTYTQLPTQEAVFIVIKQGVANQTYSVSINGTQASYTTGNTDQPETYRAETVAQNLATQINNAAVNLQAASYGGFVRVIHAFNEPLTFAWKDSWGNQAMYAMKNKVNSAEDLPRNFISGYPIEVAGVGASGYYVHWVQKNPQKTASYGLDNQVQREFGISLVARPGNVWTATEGEDTGVYEECARPGVASVLDPATMPHALIREKDGTFTFKPLTWDKRGCGDEASVPSPSFIGKPIVDMFFHRNRLGFLSEQSVVFSRAGEFFNLWPVTAKDVFDGDPIDTLVNHTKVSVLRHTAVFNNQLIIFSDHTQFVVSAQNLLTPKTVTITPSTEFTCSRLARPINSGRDVFFVADRGNYTQVQNYFVVPNAQSNSAVDVTAHVPRYIPRAVHKLALCPTEDVMLALSEQAPNEAYVYKYLFDGEKKLQESWSVFTFANPVVSVDFVGTKGYLVTRSSQGLNLEVMNFETNFVDGPLGPVHMDRKVRLAPAIAGTVSSLYELPYAVPEGLVAISAVTGQQVAVTPVELAENTVEARGNPGELIFGVPYRMRYQFSPIYFKPQGQTMVGSQLIVKTFTVHFTEGVAFNLSVQLPGRTARNSPWVSRKAGTVGSLLGAIEVAQGEHTVAIQGEGKDAVVTVENTSPYPLTLQSVSYEGFFNMRTRRV